MKKYFSDILLVLLGCVLFVSCADDDYAVLDKGHDELSLKVNGTELVLDEKSYSNDGIVIDWTTGTNYGTGNRIYYTLEIDRVGNGFANPYIAVNEEDQVYSWSKSVESLNELMREYFMASAGETVALEARLIATVAEQTEKQTVTITFSVTPYEPVTSTLYLIGDATPNGWSADNATEMTRTDNGVFTWTGNLSSGNFKFITTLGEFIPSYNKGTDGLLVLRTDFSEPDEQFVIEEAHAYKIDVNLLTRDITIVQVEGVKPAYEELYFVGNMTGWGFEKMEVDLLDPFLFRYGRYFDKGGDFKFGTADGSWENMFKATVGNASYTDTTTEFIKGFDPDNKWYLNDDEINKAYKICFDVRTGRERMMMTEFIPYEMIYLVGSAAPCDWNISDATPMIADDSDAYTFTWEGELKEGELKFACDRQSDWNGAWFLAPESDKTPNGETERMLFIDKSNNEFANQYIEISVGGIDQKWKITETGTYKITLNQLKETVSIVKQ